MNKQKNIDVLMDNVLYLTVMKYHDLLLLFKLYILIILINILNHFVIPSSQKRNIFSKIIINK